MSTHAELRALVERYGDRVLRQADHLRATLDDYFTEDEATTGEMNLLVDAVRLGAHDHLLSMLDNGVPSRTAIDTAGARLAEARGGHHRSSSWAVAVIGHALGRIPEADVLAYHSQPGPTALPPQDAFPPPPVTQRPATQRPITQPAHEPTAPAPAPHAEQGPPQDRYRPYEHPTWEQPGPEGTAKRTGVWAVLAVALVLAIAVVVVLLNRDDTPTGTEFDPEISLDEVDAAYSSLGDPLTEGASACERLEPDDGQAEVVTCTYQHLDVVLTRYEDIDALEARRTSAVEDAAAVDYKVEDAEISPEGEFHALWDMDVDDSWMYWDSTSGLASGYVEGTATSLRRRAAYSWFDQRRARDAARPFKAPVAPFTSERMWDVAQYILFDHIVEGELPGCSTDTPGDGDVEAITCLVEGYTLSFFTQVNEEALLDERSRARDGAVYTDEPWSYFQVGDGYDYPSTGWLASKNVAGGQAQVYWDDIGLLVTAYLVSDAGSLRDATEFWCLDREQVVEDGALRC